MSEAPALAPPGSVSLGARFYEATPLPGHPWQDLHPLVQAKYEAAAVTFVSRLTYTESEGVREALLSSLLLTALKSAESFMAGFEGDELQEGIDARLAAIRAAIAQAERA